MRKISVWLLCLSAWEVSAGSPTYGSEMPNKEKATACMPCKIHSDQIVEIFCEDHKAVFCKLCKLVKHSSCAVEYIQEAVKKINVKSEFEASFADLLQLQELMKEKQTENQHQLDTYSKNKNKMKSAAESLRKQLNEIFDTYEENLNTGEQASLEKLSLKVQSYTSFLSQLEFQLKGKKAIEHEATEEGLFLSVAEMRLLYASYKQEVDTLEREVAGPKSVALQDERLPSVIQRLLQISSIKEEACVEVEVGKEQAATDKCHSNIMEDQSCQVEKLTQDYSEAKTEEVRVYNSALTIVDDAEHGSSDDVREQVMVNYPKVSFSDIKSCSLESEPIGCSGITDCCFMPDGQAVLCGSSGLMVYDTGMKEKVSLRLRNSQHLPEAIDVMDSKNVVVSVGAAKLLQIISIIPNIQLGKQIVLKYTCSDVNCHNNKIFTYSTNLFETSCFRYPGIQALDRNGELLKTIPIFDSPSRFRLTRNGNNVYSTTRYSDSQYLFRIKCITQENTDIFSYSVSGNISVDSVIPDDDGTLIVCDKNSQTVSVINSDGTAGKVLVKLNVKNENLKMFYNRHNNTLLILKYESMYQRNGQAQRNSLELYRIDML